MKYNLKKEMQLKLTLDSTEALMFMRGGYHEVTVAASAFGGPVDEVVKVRVQIEKDQMARLNHVSDGKYL